MKRLITALSLICISTLAHAAGSLYPGEQVLTVNHTQTLIKFVKGDSNKPLVIFVPGDSHLARIAYGAPENTQKDFLAYWLHQRGYSFLGASYPLDNPVYTQLYPAFSIQDWGKLIAATAAKIINEQHLNKHIIVVGWSMGGSVEAVVNVEAKKLGLTLDVFIALSAVPPLPVVMQSGYYDTNQLLPNNMVDRHRLFPVLVKLLQDQNQFSHHTIISPNQYLKEFLGNIPAALSAEGYYYQQNNIKKDDNFTLKDSAVYHFNDTPWIAVIRDDAPTTAKISLIDPASWNFLRAEMINANYLRQQDLSALPDAKWRELSTLINELPNTLTATVHGNHFFFLGEQGARETADKIAEMAAKVEQLKQTIPAILSNVRHH